MKFTNFNKNKKQLLLFCIFLFIGYSHSQIAYAHPPTLASHYNLGKKNIFLASMLIPTDPTISIAILPNDPITLSSGELFEVQVCQGKQLRLEGNSTGIGNLTYEWRDVFTNFTVATGAVFEGALPESVYALFVTDEEGTVRSSASIQICLLNTPPINVSISTEGATTLCSEDEEASLTLTANAESSANSPFCGAPRFKYQWYKDGALLEGETQSTLTIDSEVENEGLYSVEVSNDCGSANLVSVQINTIPAAPEDVAITSPTNSNGVLCIGQSITLQATANNGVDTYRWFLNGGATPVGTGSSYTTNIEGSYTVEAINGCGSAISDIFEVEVITTPAVPDVLSSPIDGIGCSTEGVVLLIDNINSNNRLDTIRWFKDNAIIQELVFPFSQGVNFTAFETGTYYVELINTCGKEVSSTVDVFITQVPTFAAIEATPFSTFAPNCVPAINEITLSVDTDGENLAYEWFYSADEEDYVLIENSSSINITAAGYYKVALCNACLSCEENEELGLSDERVFSEAIYINEITDAPIQDVILFTDEANPSCLGTLTLQTDEAGTGARYDWYLNSELLATTSEPSFTATVSGIYSLIISNACGSSNLSNELPVEIKLFPSDVQISPSGSELFCYTEFPTPFTMQAAAQGTDLSYTWFKNGQPVGTGSTINVVSSGTYTVKASNDCGEATSAAKSINFEVPPLPQNTILVADICQSPIELRVVSSGTNATYQWFRRVGAGSTLLATTNNANYQVTQNGTYFAKIANACNTEGIFTNDVEVVIGNTLPLPSIVSSPSPTIDRICQGESLTLQAQISNATGLTYRWFKDNVLVTGQQSATLEVNQSGTYRVEVFLENNPTCSRLSLPYFVFVRPQPSLLVSHRGPLAFCEGDSTILRANATITPIKYNWYKDGNFVQSSNTLIAKEEGSYRLDAIYSDAVVSYPCAEQLSQSISVTTSPSPVPTIGLEGGILTVLEQGEIYQWNLNGIPILNANSPTYLPLDSGRYSVTLVNAVGCAGTSEEISHPGTYLEVTPSIQVAPNPNQGSFHLIITSQSSASIQIFNAQGQIVFEEQEVNKVNSIAGYAIVRVNHLTQGLYYLKANFDGRSLSKKIVVQ